ncbi:MAG: 4Fe-4S binding protein [Deltaproteobacteria bacterium]|nr:4Fe-4S binding protein [Deltaproteobacteria bacterium]MBW2120811.1 4Fe-4S binding protein [Deltaproteobacteria bacterium]
MYPRIDAECCDECGVCMEICPSEVYRLEGEGVRVVFPEECIECGACVEQCPKECIYLADE